MGIEKQTVSLRLDEEMIKKLKDIGEQENRTISNVIETVLKNYFKLVDKKDETK